MTNSDKLKECFVTALVLPAGTDVTSLTYQTHPVWDSVAHMRLVAGIENAFDIMFTTEQILDMSSFDKASAIVSQHGVNLKS
jgi:acyl carrier protein